MTNGNECGLGMDFSWKEIARVCREQWETNPLCRRLWRLIRPYALAFALIQVITTGSGLLIGLISQGGAFGSVPGAAAIGLGVLTSAFSMVILVLEILAPLVYAKWAYHKTFLNDDMLRLANLSFRDRLMGILVPAVVAIGMVWLVVFVVGLIQAILVFRGFSGSSAAIPFKTSPGSMALLTFVSVLNHVVFAIGYSLVFASVVVRRLIQAPWGGGATGRGAGYVAIPYLIGAGVAFAVSLLGSVPMMFVMFIGIIPAMRKSPGKMTPAAMRSIPLWAGSLFVTSLAIRVLIAAAMLLLLRSLLASLWRNDIPAARAWLFGASSYGDMASVAPPGGLASSPVPSTQNAAPPPGPAPNLPPVPFVHVCYPDGTWYGPYPINDVVSWSREGRIPPNVWIRDVAGDARARPLSDELADYPTGPPTLGERLIPKNRAAVLSYYLGLASFVGLFMCVVPGVILGIIAIILGVRGLRRAREKPHLRGKAHAITGIVAASICLLIGIAVGLHFL